jgi:hypothetical protein
VEFGNFIDSFKRRADLTLRLVQRIKVNLSLDLIKKAGGHGMVEV